MSTDTGSTVEASPSADSLGIIGAMHICRHEGRLYAHLSFGRIIDELATRYQKVYLCVPISHGPPPSDRDYCLTAGNLHVIAQPHYVGALGGSHHLFAIARTYWQALRSSRHVFVRGMMPWVSLFYFMAWILGRQPCHWIVGNPVALLRSHRRAGWLKDSVALLYALQDRWFTRFGRWLTNGSLLCNGDELAGVFRSPRTTAVISTTIRRDEFFVREDTCTGDEITLLFIGFVRPEKGIEYLLEAVAQLPNELPWRLQIVGPTDGYPAYYAQLLKTIQQLKIEYRVSWEGYVPYGPEMWRYLRQSDIFILPTLSEGTPRVLVEARANCLPVIATRVGGIPSSITDGWDGVLVPAKDAKALADSVARIASDGSLRRSLIANGLVRAKELTVEAFVDRVAQTLTNSQEGLSYGAHP